MEEKKVKSPYTGREYKAEDLQRFTIEELDEISEQEDRARDLEAIEEYRQERVARGNWFRRDD